jgi:holin-like protein
MMPVRVASERALSRPTFPVLPTLVLGRWARTTIDAGRLVLQVAMLWGFSAGGTALQLGLHLPVPGNVIGLCALYLGLVSGVIRPQWFELGGGFLTKHLAFFFIPVTVGVLGFGGTFARAGVGIVSALVISTILGIVLTGVTTQRLARRR